MPTICAIGSVCMRFRNCSCRGGVSLRTGGKYKEAIEKISASSSYGGKPRACAAALASIEVMEDDMA
jgi:adenosylmethionine-8-amino-7-oxononanoate aminotransferase